LADLQRTVYPHSGHPSCEGRAQDSVSSPSKHHEQRRERLAKQLDHFHLVTSLNAKRR